jgi:hypothetical protein
MFGRRKHRGEGRRPRAARKDSQPVEPLSVPGYGTPPVTRPLGDGPQPSPYGVRPDIDPGEWTEDGRSP